MSVEANFLQYVRWQQRRYALGDKQRVKEMVLEMISQLLHSSLLPFILQILGEILNLGNMSTPSGVDISLHLTPKRNVIVWQASRTPKARGNLRQAKTGNVLMIFGWNIFLAHFVIVWYIRARQQSCQNHHLTCLNMDFVTDWAQTWIFQTQCGRLICLK